MAQRSAKHIKAQKDGKLRDNFRCQICGSTEKINGHHIVDVQFGGAADADNIVALCKRHHDRVHNGEIDINKF